MRGPNSSWLERFYSVFSICFLITTATHAQRLVLPPDSTTPSQSKSQVSSPSAPESSGTHVLKTYPDGTKKIVPLEALNYRDDGAAFGGPPRLALYDEPTPATILAGKNPERLSVAPIGIEGQSADLNASVPASPDALAGSTLVAALKYAKRGT